MGQKNQEDNISADTCLRICTSKVILQNFSKVPLKPWVFAGLTELERFGRPSGSNPLFSKSLPFPFFLWRTWKSNLELTFGLTNRG